MCPAFTNRKSHTVKLRLCTPIYTPYSGGLCTPCFNVPISFTVFDFIFRFKANLVAWLPNLVGSLAGWRLSRFVIEKKPSEITGREDLEKGECFGPTIYDEGLKSKGLRFEVCDLGSRF